MTRKNGISAHFSYKLHCNQRNDSSFFGFGKIKIYNIIPRLKWAENILSQFYMHVFFVNIFEQRVFSKNLILWEYDFQKQKYVQQQFQAQQYELATKIHHYIASLINLLFHFN